jgi:hypothetical protein
LSLALDAAVDALHVAVFGVVVRVVGREGLGGDAQRGDFL